MMALTPIEAAHIADKIYAVLESTLAFLGERKKSFEVIDQFEGETGNITIARWLSSGNWLQRKIAAKSKRFAAEKSAMGAIAKRNQHEILIAVRGTITGADQATDANASKTACNHLGQVHSGFLHTYRSFEPVIQKHKALFPDAAMIHCVCHSLGGALATLSASFIKIEYGGRLVKLYTFGSPRVGDKTFARKVTQSLGKNNIYRVYHDCDPVSKVPLNGHHWAVPSAYENYFHVPMAGESEDTAYRIIFNAGTSSNSLKTRLAHMANAHRMTNYINSVRGKSWSSLKASARIPSPQNASTTHSAAQTGESHG